MRREAWATRPPISAIDLDSASEAPATVCTLAEFCCETEAEAGTPCRVRLAVPAMERAVVAIPGAAGRDARRSPARPG